MRSGQYFQEGAVHLENGLDGLYQEVPGMFLENLRPCVFNFLEIMYYF